MLEAFCYFLGALFLAIGGQTMIAGIKKEDIKLKLNSLFNLCISGVWMIIGILVSYLYNC